MTTQVPAESAITFGQASHTSVRRIGPSSSAFLTGSSGGGSGRSSSSTGISATPISDISAPARAVSMLRRGVLLARSTPIPRAQSAMGACGIASCHLAPLAGRGRIASAMPTGRANARPMTGSASSGAIRVRGTLRAFASFEFAEAAPHPNPLRSELRSSRPQERGEGRSTSTHYAPDASTGGLLLAGLGPRPSLGTTTDIRDFYPERGGQIDLMILLLHQNLPNLLGHRVFSKSFALPDTIAVI